MSEKRIRKIAFAGVTGSLYAALTISLSFIGFGPIQFRIAEALCILPFFAPVSVWGLAAGCVCANLFSPYPLDVFVGPLATLFAGLCTMRIGKSRREGAGRKALACLPPVIFNAIFIGALISFYITGGGKAETIVPAFIVNGLYVGLGEAVVMYAVGLPLMFYLPKSRIFGKTIAGVQSP